MHKLVFEDAATKYTRISKREARKLWGKEDIALCPCNLRPGFPWAPHIVIPAKDIAENLKSEYDFVRDRSDFDNCVAEFEGYNCTCRETGKYAAFYTIEPLTKEQAHGDHR